MESLLIGKNNRPFPLCTEETALLVLGMERGRMPLPFPLMAVRLLPLFSGGERRETEGRESVHPHF